MCYLYEDGGSRYENCRPEQGGALAQRAAGARQVGNAPHSFAFGGGLFLEQADEFDREVAALGSSDKFMSFLDARSKEEEDIPLSEARSKRGL